jgi:cupin-like protein
MVPRSPAPHGASPRRHDRRWPMGSIRSSSGRGAAACPGPTRSDRGFLKIDASTFHASFDRHAFKIGHGLGDHPLFSLPRLLQLSTRLPERSVVYGSGDVSVGEGLYKGRPNGLSVEETIRRIEQCRSWMVLKSIEDEPEYREMLDSCLDEVDRLSAPVVSTTGKRKGFIFISSPGSITPFHIDPEYNFLLQIRGRKRLHVVDPADRAVLTEEALEQFYAGASAGVNVGFEEQYRRRATCFDLSPGDGLYIPVTAPHWVENGSEVSISFSITFETSASERRSIIYAAHARLRRLGLRPPAIGRSAVSDAATFYGLRALRRARCIVSARAKAAG